MTKTIEIGKTYIDERGDYREIVPLKYDEFHRWYECEVTYIDGWHILDKTTGNTISHYATAEEAEDAIDEEFNGDYGTYEAEENFVTKMMELTKGDILG